MAPGRRSIRFVALAAAVVLSTLGLAHRARANGRFPAANHLVVHPEAPRELVLRATFGLLVSRDAGATWHWVCERAVGFSGAQDPPVLVTQGGAVLAAL